MPIDTEIKSTAPGTETAEAQDAFKGARLPISAHAAGANPVEDAIRALKIMGDLDVVPGARSFQLSLAALSNAYGYCSPPRDPDLDSAEICLNLAASHLSQTAASGSPQADNLHTVFHEAWERLDAFCRQPETGTGLLSEAHTLIITGAHQALELAGKQ